MRLIVAWLLVAAALAGCTDEPGDEAGPGPGTGPGTDAPPLQGWVFDEAVRPLPGVTVSVLEQPDAMATTDSDGWYEFEGLPFGTPLFVAVSLPDFEPQTKGVTLHADLPTRLNFTMARVPVAQPFHQVVPFDGFIGCQAVVVVGEEITERQDCGGGTDIDTFGFTAEGDLAGVIVEIAWTPTQELAASFHASLYIGDDTEPVTEGIGTSILRLHVPEATTRERLPVGGDMRVVVQVLPDTDANEAGVGVGVAVNQDFQAFASLFYVAPPDPTYTIAG